MIKPFQLTSGRASTDTLWVLAGTITGKLFGLVNFIILTKKMLPEDYGLISIGLAFMTLASDLSDLGINASIIRFGSEFHAQNDTASLTELFSHSIRFRLLAGIIATAGGLLLVQPIATLGYGRPFLAPYLALSLAALVFNLLNSAFGSMLQAQKKFPPIVLINLTYGVVTVLGTVVLLFSGNLTPLTCLGVYFLAPIASSAVGYGLNPRSLIKLRVQSPAIKTRISNFGKWIFFWSVNLIIFNQINIFMLSRLSSVEMIGFYNAGLRIAVLVQLLPGAYATVMITRFSSWANDPVALKQEYKKSLWISLGIAAAILLSSAFSGLAVKLLTSADYQPVVPILQVLLAGMAVFALASPHEKLLLALNRPYWLVISLIAGNIVAILADFWLIPGLGGYGASIAFFAAQVVILLVLAAGAYILGFKKNR